MKHTWIVFALVLGWVVPGALLSLHGAEMNFNSVSEWRRLTLPMADPPPRAFLHDDDVRIWFDTSQGLVQFKAHLERPRIPNGGFQVGSGVLRLKWVPRTRPARTWREAVVVTGDAWPGLQTRLVEGLAPKAPGHGSYYQGLMLERLVYRDAQGHARSTTVEQPRDPVTIDAHFSIEETLQALARSLTDELRRTYPESSLFVVIAPRLGRFPQPLLLDVANRRCIWLLPEGLTDPQRALSLVTSPAGISALTLESHGWALLKNPVSSAARLLDLGLETLARLPRLPLPRGEPPPVHAAQKMDLADWEHWLDKYTGTHREPATLQLLVNGEQFFPRLHDAVTAATNHIRFECFIFDRDDTAVEVAGDLKRRSVEVETKVLMDRLGSLAAGFSPPATPLPENFTPPRSMTSFLRNGSDVSVRHFLDPWFTVDHSKVYLIDGTQAWLGGMNIGREYRVEWHDLMVEVKGPMVSSFERSFERHWAHEGPLGDLAYLGALFEQGPFTPLPETTVQAGDCIPVRRLPTRTLWKPFSAAVQRSIQRAQNYIYVENPYLFDRRVIGELIRARYRGVDVRVILPGVNDFKAGGRSNLVIANLLLSHGVRVFFYPGMTHVKALLVDDWTCVGSGNLSHLSLRIAQEDNIATSDLAFAKRLKRELFEPDFVRSYELSHPLAVNWLDELADFLVENL